MNTLPSLSLDTDRPLTATLAFDHVYDNALRDSEPGPVGIELETHLVDLDHPGRRVSWDRVLAVLPAVERAAGRSLVTLEPGGQVELSGPPIPTVVDAIAELRLDEQRVRLALSEVGLGLAHIGCDPVRPVERSNPRPRYRAMEEHYRSTGQGEAGAAMMSSTAALQINIESGRTARWADRVNLAHRLGPVFVAISANSPWLANVRSPWKSLRRRVWAGLDPRSCAPQRLSDDPRASWASYALAAPVVLVAGDGGQVDAVRSHVPFLDWVTGNVSLGGRRPTVVDLHTHLTTLFPPVRLRGYLELRYLDVVGPRWWPALTAAVTTLMDHPVAADEVAECLDRRGVVSTAALWQTAAQRGLDDDLLAGAAAECMTIAASYAPVSLRFAVEDLAEMATSRRCPADEIDARISEVGPAIAFQELAHA